MRIEIIREIDKLRTMSVNALREKYLEVFGETTRTGNKVFLYKRIAWRIQAIEEGDYRNVRDDALSNWLPMPTYGFVPHLAPKRRLTRKTTVLLLLMHFK